MSTRKPINNNGDLVRRSGKFVKMTGIRDRIGSKSLTNIWTVDLTIGVVPISPTTFIKVLIKDRFFVCNVWIECNALWQ